MLLRLTCCISLVLLTACANKSASTRVGEAAVTPLNDLNLIKTDIPPLLQQIQSSPYQVPAGYTCDSLTTDIADLDAVLGPDLDEPASEDKPGLMERGSNAAQDAAIGAFQRTTESVVPFRGWIRKLTGAERRSRKVAVAITAGTARRSFLKGLRASQNCAPDAALPATPAPPATPASSPA